MIFSSKDTKLSGYEHDRFSSLTLVKPGVENDFETLNLLSILLAASLRLSLLVKGRLPTHDFIFGMDFPKSPAIEPFVVISQGFSD